MVPKMTHPSCNLAFVSLLLYIMEEHQWTMSFSSRFIKFWNEGEEAGDQNPRISWILMQYGDGWAAPNWKIKNKKWNLLALNNKWDDIKVTRRAMCIQMALHLFGLSYIIASVFICIKSMEKKLYNIHFS